MQYRAARVVSRTAPETDDEVARENRGRLNVQQSIEYNTALLIWKSKQALAPTYISDMFVPVKSVMTLEMLNLAFILGRKV